MIAETHRMPDFFVIGAAKSATTSLCVALGRHPEIFVPQKKELNFFNQGDAGELSQSHYCDYFSPAGNDQIVGEGSISYSLSQRYPGTAGRIAAGAQDSKIIYIVRDPVDRIVSFYLQLSAAGTLSSTIDTALAKSDTLLDSALYWRQLNEYRKHWADDSILVLFFEDWVKDQNQVLARCHEFLGVGEHQLAIPVKAFTATRGQRIDRRGAALFRKLPFAGEIRDRLPARVRSFLRKNFKREVVAKPELSVATKRFILDAVREDCVQLLAHCGREGLWVLN